MAIGLPVAPDLSPVRQPLHALQERRLGRLQGLRNLTSPHARLGLEQRQNRVVLLLRLRQHVRPAGLRGLLGLLGLAGLGGGLIPADRRRARFWSASSAPTRAPTLATGALPTAISTPALATATNQWMNARYWPCFGVRFWQSDSLRTSNSFEGVSTQPARFLFRVAAGR